MDITLLVENFPEVAGGQKGHPELYTHYLVLVPLPGYDLFGIHKPPEKESLKGGISGIDFLLKKLANKLYKYSIE